MRLQFQASILKSVPSQTGWLGVNGRAFGGASVVKTTRRFQARRCCWSLWAEIFRAKVMPLNLSINCLCLREEPIMEIVEAYIKHRLMPSDPLGDALHLAITSYHGCDFLLTWNCKHIANANKFAHIRRVNAILGIYCPSLVTPLELMEIIE